jgi:transcription initiation factor TFIIE subunit alpha
MSCRHIRDELKEGFARKTPRVWYYLDMRHFVDVLKWRIYTIRTKFEEANVDVRLRLWLLGLTADGYGHQLVSQLGFQCPRCKKTYDQFEFSALCFAIGGELNEAPCEQCGTIIVENDSTQKVEEGKKMVKRFLEQCDGIVQALKKTESWTVPRCVRPLSPRPASRGTHLTTAST